MLRLALLCGLIVCVLATAGAAFAGGPVFDVAPRGATPDSLNQAIRRQLKVDRSALLASQRRLRRDAALLEHAQAEVGRASASPFPAEDRATRLQQTLNAERERAAGIQRAIKRLSLALQPVHVAADFLSSPPSTVGSYAVAIAQRFLDVRYVWGGSTPASGFDCSGFVQYVYSLLGVTLPHYAASQYKTTRHIDPSQLEPGDLVFFEPRADGPGHVGMYVGNDVFIEAPHTGDVVKFARVSTEASLLGFVGATRPTF